MPVECIETSRTVIYITELACLIEDQVTRWMKHVEQEITIDPNNLPSCKVYYKVGPNCLEVGTDSYISKGPIIYPYIAGFTTVIYGETCWERFARDIAEEIQHVDEETNA